MVHAQINVIKRPTNPLALSSISHREDAAKLYYHFIFHGNIPDLGLG